MAFGDTTLQRGDNNTDVIELQLRLSGFRGTLWDGDFGPGTELQVISFQKDFMNEAFPSGIVNTATFQAMQDFAGQYPIDFQPIRCPCGECAGFGNNQFEGSYRVGKPHVEAYHRREYPGIHKAILYAYRGACFHLEAAGFPKPFLSSGYRCWVNNNAKGRKSTNHMGKALDMDLPLQPGDDKRDDANRCEAARGVLIEKAGFQNGWAGSNRKALEPANIAPTWVHMDVRCYAPRYLSDEYYVLGAGELDR